MARERFPTGLAAPQGHRGHSRCTRPRGPRVRRVDSCWRDHGHLGHSRVSPVGCPVGCRDRADRHDMRLLRRCPRRGVDLAARRARVADHGRLHRRESCLAIVVAVVAVAPGVGLGVAGRHVRPSLLRSSRHGQERIRDGVAAHSSTTSAFPCRAHCARYPPRAIYVRGPARRHPSTTARTHLSDAPLIRRTGVVVSPLARSRHLCCTIPSARARLGSCSLSWDFLAMSESARGAERRSRGYHV